MDLVVLSFLGKIGLTVAKVLVFVAQSGLLQVFQSFGVWVSFSNICYG
jgi:hypothetical protein